MVRVLFIAIAFVVINSNINAQTTTDSLQLRNTNFLKLYAAPATASYGIQFPAAAPTANQLLQISSITGSRAISSWVNAGTIDSNIYRTNGTLAGARDVLMNSNKLIFDSATATGSTRPVLFLNATTGSPISVGIGTQTPTFTTPSNSGASIPTFGVDGTINTTNYTSAVQTLSLSTYATTAIAWDLSKGSNIVVTNGNTPTSTTSQQYLITITNLKAGMYGTLVIRQNSSTTYQATNTIKVTSATTYSGSSVTNNFVINGGNGVAGLTTTSSTASTYVSDVLCFFFDGTNIWWTIGNNYN